MEEKNLLDCNTAHDVINDGFKLIVSCCQDGTCAVVLACFHWTFDPWCGKLNREMVSTLIYCSGSYLAVFAIRTLIRSDEQFQFEASNALATAQRLCLSSGRLHRRSLDVTRKFR